MRRSVAWAVLASSLFALVTTSGCDLLKKKDAAMGADGLPTECGDYLAVYECTLAKGNAPNAHDTAEQLRASYKTMASSVGNAQLAKTCTDAMASTKTLSDQLGCVKGALATAAPAATTSATAAATATAAAAAKTAPVAKAAAKAGASGAASAVGSAAPKAAKKSECSCSSGQVLFSDKDTSICAVLPCRGPGGSCKKEDKTEGTCIEQGTGEAGQRERCGHLIQCL